MRKKAKQKTNGKAREALYRKLRGEKFFLGCKYEDKQTVTAAAEEDSHDTMATGTHTHTHTHTHKYTHTNTNNHHTHNTMA